MSTEEKITKLEEQIEILEKELNKLKQEVAAIKVAEGFASNTASYVYSMPIEDVGFSTRTYNCLKRAGFNTLSDCLTITVENYSEIRNLGRKSFEEILGKISILINPDKIESFSLKNIIPAYELYRQIREKAKEEGIGFYHMSSGIFSDILRKSRSDHNFVYMLTEHNTCLLKWSFCEECDKGRHPEMYKLLTMDEVDEHQIKAAIIEDFKENNVIFDERTKTYADSLRFIKLIQEFKISE